ncbi:MAG: Glu/Leu/Phe/Val dehydrogenase [Alphaproteobacteria bacterium]|nr:Glu/Leu/Phe/Val dehydrogenase [Alphaproteobacteria bacterium]MCB9929685.1 Glu/Leu/Phe/Val dehydrogenase [Alphaproteobacteria bacterium]
MAFAFTDDLGPEKVVELYDAGVGLKAIVVVDNTAAGPAIGGTRMAPDVTLEECFGLARAMTFKNAAAGLPHGGAKSVIAADPAMPIADKERLIRAFARGLREITSYIPGPDMGTNEEAMAWIRDENGRSVGLPRELGGIPLDVIGATGYGLAACAEIAEKHCDVRLKGARVAVQGFGAVGYHGARFLANLGCVLVAAADSRGMTLNPDGLDIEALAEHHKTGEGVAAFAGGTAGDRDAIVGVDCDIWIPAARPNVLTAANAGQVKARLILQGANIPATAEAEAALHARGVLSVPDFIANAGGVICASVEYHGGSESGALATIKEKIQRNTDEVLRRMQRDAVLPRAAAVAMARERVERAMRFRRDHR